MTSPSHKSICDLLRRQKQTPPHWEKEKKRRREGEKESARITFVIAERFDQDQSYLTYLSNHSIVSHSMCNRDSRAAYP